MRHARRITLTTAALLAAASLGAGGCNQNGRHGNYTKEGVKLAQTRISQLKSGTEWQMAQQQYLGGDLDKALKSVDKSIALNPGVAKSHVLRGRILIEKGEIERAQQSLNTALEIDAVNVDAHYFLGIVHERFRMDQQALEYYQKAAELEPSNPQYTLAAAEMLVNLSRIDEAEQLLSARKESFGYSAAIRQTLGHIAVLRGQHDKAADYFSDALLLAPDDPAILEDLARSQIACGRFGDAEFNLDRLLKLEQNSDRRDLELLRARCLMAIDRPVDARSLMQTVTNTPEGASDPLAWIELGNAALVLKDKASLRAAGARTSALAPDRYEGHLFRAAYLNLDGQKEQSLVALDNAIERCGRVTTPFILRATVLMDLGRPQDAQKTLASALERNPQDAATIALRASLDQSFATVDTESVGNE